MGRIIKRWLWRLLAIWLLLTIIPVVIVRFVDPPIWMWRIAHQINPPAPVSQVQQQWRSIKQISPNLQLAVMASEDQKFPDHYGFDVSQIKNAIEDAANGEGLRGASTISQQTAKNLFMWPLRSFIRKGFEAWFTGLLEIICSKQRILELYLNVVEFGPGIYGAEAAAQHYFHLSAAKLSRYQAAQLAAILPNPWKLSPYTAYTNKRSKWIQQQMRQLGQVTLNKLH